MKYEQTNSSSTRKTYKVEFESEAEANLTADQLADKIIPYNYGGGFISRNDSKAEIYIYID